MSRSRANTSTPEVPPVEAVGGMDVATELVAQHLDGEARLVAVELAAVEQARGFVDRDDVIVLVDDGQHGAAW